MEVGRSDGGREEKKMIGFMMYIVIEGLQGQEAVRVSRRQCIFKEG